MEAGPQQEEARPLPPEWRGAIPVAWLMLLLAVLLLPLAGLITALVGIGLLASRLKQSLGVFFLVAGLGFCLLGLLFRPVIDTDKGINDPSNAIPLENHRQEPLFPDE